MTKVQKKKVRGVAAEAAKPAAPAAASAVAASKAFDDLFAAVNRSDMPGVVVGVRHRGKTLLRQGYGMASLEHAVANTPATRMRIGSVTKHFTCLAVLLLAEDGKLDVDAPVTAYLPELPVLRGVPTLRQLMTHTGGYRCHIDLACTAAGLTVQPAGKGWQAMVSQSDANFPPGESQIYCNGGYHLLSIVVDRVSGMSLEAFLLARIFEPLGMVATRMLPSDLDILPGMATHHAAYSKDGKVTWRRGIFMSEEVRGEGGLVSTVDDLLVWLAHLRASEKIVGTAASWRQMTALTVLNNGLTVPYGLGLFRHEYRGVEIVYHHGAVLGGACQMLTVPEHELDIVVITNGGPINHIDATKRIIDQVLGDVLKGDPAPAMAGIKGLEHLSGAYYVSDNGLVFGFGTVGEKLGISLLFSKPAPLLRDEGKQLRIAFEDAGLGPFQIERHALAAGKDGKAPDRLIITECGNTIRCKRLPSRAPSTAKVGESLVGRYRCDDLDADGTITFDGDQLVLRTQGGYGSRTVDLKAVSADCFRMTWRDDKDPLTSALIPTFEDGVVTGFVFNTFRVRHLRFARLPNQSTS